MRIRRLTLTAFMLLAGVLFTACQAKDDKSAYQEQVAVGSVSPTESTEPVVASPTALPRSTIASQTALPESTKASPTALPGSKKASPTALPESTTASPTALPDSAKASRADLPNPTKASRVAGEDSVSDLPDIPTATDAKDSNNQIAEVDLMGVISEDISKEFYFEELSAEVIDRIQGKSYKKDCTVPYEELRYVRVLYWGFDEEAHRGELVVNKAIAKDAVEIFRKLYDVKYPIERMVLVDEYDADDNESMAADNTSCFNYRNVDGKNTLSQHSYGLAIDINPLYNPYVRTIDGKEDVLPVSGTKYADRARKCKYYIDTEDACYKAFTEHGFTWGGEWLHSKDYQHFQKKLD